MSLDKIYKEISSDSENAWAAEKGWKPVYTAHKDAHIVIIGQAPGIRAQESGIPWNDKSGDNLRQWMGIDSDTFYDERKIALIPMDFYFPGSKERGDMPPRPGFAEKWHPRIFGEMKNIDFIILIGQYAQDHYLGDNRKKTLTDTVQYYSEYLPDYFPLVHPSPRNNIWQKKNPWFKEKVLPVLREEVGKRI